MVTKTYFEAAQELKTLKQQQAQLQTALDGLVNPIAQAQAAVNKAAQSLLRAAERGEL
jgi:hypothetical protein